jgi:integration host factor subunit beta
MATKREIVKVIAERTALTQVQANDLVQAFLDALVETVIQERRVELRNFGVFELKTRAPRKARNPRTGETLIVPERQAIVFKPGRAFEEQLASVH